MMEVSNIIRNHSIKIENYEKKNGFEKSEKQV